MKKLLPLVLLSFALSVSAFAGTAIKVATLNCFLFFSPAVEHSGQVDKESPLTPEAYATKVTNLASLTTGVEFVGLQETGGRVEIEALAAAAGAQWAFAKGKDTYTGEEVGALYRLPGWSVTVNGRVADLDRLVSKHLLVTAKKGKETIKFLVLHLIRPIGEKGTAKHAAQVKVIAEWARATSAAEGTTAVLVGDMNDTEANMFGLGQEAGELNRYAATHLSHKCFDHLVAVGGGASWSHVEVVTPPYGPRPNKTNTALWTDHFMLKASLELP